MLRQELTMSVRPASYDDNLEISRYSLFVRNVYVIDADCGSLFGGSFDDFFQAQFPNNIDDL